MARLKAWCMLLAALGACAAGEPRPRGRLHRCPRRGSDMRSAERAPMGPQAAPSPYLPNIQEPRPRTTCASTSCRCGDQAAPCAWTAGCARRAGRVPPPPVRRASPACGRACPPSALARAAALAPTPAAILPLCAGAGLAQQLPPGAAAGAAAGVWRHRGRPAGGVAVHAAAPHRAAGQGRARL